MTTIKGPIKMTGGFNAKEFLAMNAKDIKVKLPFKATGFKSTKMPKNVDLTGIELAKEKPAKKKSGKKKK